MFQFHCGDLVDVRRRQTSAYTVGGRILVSEVSNVKQLRSEIIAARDDGNYIPGDDSGGGYTPSPTDTSSNWIPYSYGNPLVNLWGNILYQGIKMSGYDPLAKDKELY